MALLRIIYGTSCETSLNPPQALNPKPSNKDPGADVDMEDPKTRECGMMLPKQSQNLVSLTLLMPPFFCRCLGSSVCGGTGFQAV